MKQPSKPAQPGGSQERARADAGTARSGNAPGAKAVDPVAGGGGGGGGGSLQAPWRMEYLESLGESEGGAPPPPTGGTGGLPKSDADAGAASFLRDYWLAPQDDERNHVIVRTPDGLVMLNAFPYANGHLLVALGEGRPRLLDYSPEQRAALWWLTDLAADLMETALQPQGINIGVNQGRAGGAGVPGHLHVHLVPRWGGDINFMTAVAKVRVIPSSLEVMAKRYREAWGKIKGRW